MYMPFFGQNWLNKGMFAGKPYQQQLRESATVEVLEKREGFVLYIRIPQGGFQPTVGPKNNFESQCLT